MLSMTARRPAVSLTPRQLEILELLRAGLAPKEIAGRLDLSTWTVRHHIEDARKRTETRSTNHLVAVFARTREKRRTT
jgi:Response regulator containing a CheY-like receiver domain and an HTH DNA-binding domain